MTFRGVCIALSSVVLTACPGQLLLDADITKTRQEIAAVDTLHDYAIARSAAEARLGESEGLYRLAPDDRDVLFLLAEGWVRVTSSFVEDDRELALERGDELMAGHQLARVRAGYLRAAHYGARLLGSWADGFDQAKANPTALRAWLVEHFDDSAQAADLLWVGHAWLGGAEAAGDEATTAAERSVGVELVRRSVELDEAAFHAAGHVLLGAHHARTAQLVEAKRHFDRALALTSGNYLPAKLELATRYYCARADRAGYERTLNEVLAARDPLPEARLQNVIAQRRARRYLGQARWQKPCGFPG